MKGTSPKNGNLHIVVQCNLGKLEVPSILVIVACESEISMHSIGMKIFIADELDKPFRLSLSIEFLKILSVMNEITYRETRSNMMDLLKVPDGINSGVGNNVLR